MPIIEWVFIFIPIFFHAVIGVVIIRGGLPNTSNYPLSGNIRYTLQRATGMIAFAFIVWHLIHMHGFFGAPFKEVRMFPLPTGGAAFEPHQASSSAGAAIQAGIGVQILYAIGVLSCVFHLANGLWTMGITWGVWTTAAAQRRANWVCGAFGIVLAVIGLSALVGMGTLDVEDARLLEQARQEEHQDLDKRVEELRREQQGARKAVEETDASKLARQPNTSK